MPDASPPGAATRVVALVFTDIQASSSLWERRPDVAKQALEVHDTILRAGIERFAGYEIRTEGDSFKIAFASPAAAVRFCFSTQQALLEAAWPEALLEDDLCREVKEHERRLWRGLRVRMGAHFGNADPVVHPTTGRIDWYGAVVNSTARIAEAPAGGQVLASYFLWEAARHEDTRLEAMVEDLGTHRLRGVEAPEHIVQLTCPALVGRSFGPLRTQTALRMQIPPAHDRFVGRQTDITAVAAALDHARLVTLFGPGGTGKTRVALEVARGHAHAFPGGAWFTDASEARSKEDLLLAVATTLQLTTAAPSVEGIGTSLARMGRVLVILDNLEQVGPAAAVIQSWLSAAPDACFLATSRHALGLPAEVRHALDGLSANDAVELFVDRAKKIGVTIDAADRDTLTRLVGRLDCLPLAIELAASRADVLSPLELERRLDQRFRLLGGATGVVARHATLSAAIDWSWGLLEGPEREAATQCSIFAGGFPVAAAEEVVVLADDAWVVDVVQTLVRKSILRPLQERRLGMYESIRAFAAARMTSKDDVALRHARWFARASVEWAEGVYGKDDLRYYRLFRMESDNLVAAHDHLRHTDPLLAARLVEAIGPEMLPLVPTGKISMPPDYLDRVIEAVGVAERAGEHALLARLLRIQGEIVRLHMDYDAALVLFRRGHDVALQAGLRLELAMLQRELCFGFHYRAISAEAAVAYGEAARATFEALGRPVLEALADFALMTVMFRAGDEAGAAAMRDRMWDLTSRHGGTVRLGMTSSVGVFLDGSALRFEAAWKQLQPALDSIRALGVRESVWMVVVFGAIVAAGSGHIEEAERLVEETRAANLGLQLVGLRLFPDLADCYLAAAKAVRARTTGDVGTHASEIDRMRAMVRALGTAQGGQKPRTESSPMVRNMLVSLDKWLRVNGEEGLELSVDIGSMH